MHSEEAKVYIEILISAGVLALILILFILTILRQQKKHQQLHREKINAEITALEIERRRIAQDLHDDIAALLSIAKLELSAIENESENNKALLLKASGHIDNSLTKIKGIARNLMPVTLARKGLYVALEELFDSINQTEKINIQYSFSDESLPVADNAQTHLFRIIQEIIQNTLKHADASEINFSFTRNSKCLIININDNGKGFDQQLLVHHSGLGIHNIMSRMEMLDGSVYLDTTKGVNYTFEIPLTNIT